MPDHETFDVIVVGAGTAGTILASRIAENGVNPTTGDRLKGGLFEGGPYYLEGGPLQPGIGDPWRRRLVTNIKGDETDPPKWHYASPPLIHPQQLNYHSIIDVDNLHAQQLS